MNAEKQAGTSRPLSILIADDNADMVLTLAAILTDEGHIVHTCADGKQAVESIRRYKPQVCILDIGMPGMSGYDVARAVEQWAPPERPVLVAISGQFARTSDRLLAKSMGFSYFLAKPADAEDLLRVLDTIASDMRSRH
jgi:CheY-like chemotaxis protein